MKGTLSARGDMSPVSFPGIYTLAHRHNKTHSDASHQKSKIRGNQKHSPPQVSVWFSKTYFHAYLEICGFL